MASLMAASTEKIALRAGVVELQQTLGQAFAQRTQRIIEDEARDQLMVIRPARYQLLQVVAARRLPQRTERGLPGMHHVGAIAHHVAPTHRGRTTTEIVLLAVAFAERSDVETAKLTQGRTAQIHAKTNRRRQIGIIQRRLAGGSLGDALGIVGYRIVF